MARRNGVCGICESVNLPSSCANCVNNRFTDTYKTLKRLSQQRDSWRRKLAAQLVAKQEAESQRNWRAEHVERKAKLREELRIATLELKEARSKGEKQEEELDALSTSLASASNELSVKRIELGKYYPDLLSVHTLGHSSVCSELLQKRRMIMRQLCKILPLRRGPGSSEEREASGSVQPVCICGVQLPIGDDYTSVPNQELSASLGYMVQLVSLTAKYLSAPLLHGAGFAASSSRVWQRGSYFDPRPTSRSEEYPLFLPRESTNAAEEPREFGKKSGSCSSNFGFSSMDASRSNVLESGVQSPVQSSNSPARPRETHRDVQRGIKLLKRSVACINAYGYALLSLPAPLELSTFETFAELLAILVSKEQRGRSSRGSQQPNGPFGLSEGHHLSRLGSCPPNLSDDRKPDSDSLDRSKTTLTGKVNSWNDFLNIGTDSEQLDERHLESLIDGWDLVEHPTLPPPPSHSEDVEHWTRAMFIDATK